MSEEYLPDPSIFRLRSGVDYSLEEDANRLLAQSRKGITALSDKRDYLTNDQLMLRSQREVLNSNGVSDESLMTSIGPERPAMMNGMFRRVHNPLAGHRPGKMKSQDDE